VPICLATSVIMPPFISTCPNTEDGRPDYMSIYNQLEYVKNNFLDKRERNLPVIVKFSNDTKIDDIPRVMDMLFKLGYDGANFGNTSTRYAELRESIVPSERRLYDFFCEKIGGGISGKPLKKPSLLLATAAVNYLKAGTPKQEFHVGRTGGIDCAEDILASEECGISFNQFYNGYWENYMENGHDLYKKIYEGLK